MLSAGAPSDTAADGNGNVDGEGLAGPSADADVPVRLWRPTDLPRLVLLHGTTDGYAAEPHGEYVLSVISRRGLTVRRGGARHSVHPGEIAVWDQTDRHVGAPLDGGPWECHLMLVEQPDIEDVLREPDEAALDLEFPQPVIRDPRLATRFLRLHRLMDGPASTLERESLLAIWLQDVAMRSPTSTRQRNARRTSRSDPAVRRACERMRDDLAVNLSLQDLADAAGVSRFRLVRLFRTAFGLPPHAFQITQRVKAARRLLELGRPPADVAALVGFHDQSHLHRHFRPTMGMTPAQYRRAALGAGAPGR